MQVSRDAAVIHISEHYRDCSPGAKAMITVSDIEAFHREIVARPNPNIGANIENAFWGARVVELSDPFGNRLCFNQPNAK